jgi:hypothetical protein
LAAVTLAGGCTVNDDVVAATSEMVETINDLHESVGVDLPLFQRVILGPSRCTESPDPDTFQTSMRVGIVLEEDADLDVLLDDIERRWLDRGLEAQVRFRDGDLPRVQAQDTERDIGYAAEASRELHTVTLLSSTACLALPDRYDHVRDLRADFLDLVDPGGEILEPDLSRTRHEEVAEIREREG